MFGQELECKGLLQSIFSMEPWDADFYTQILEDHLIPFIREKFSGSDHIFMQNNDPKHCSHLAQKFFGGNRINWGHTPESADHNHIENLWHELKDYLRAKVKP